MKTHLKEVYDVIKSRNIVKVNELSDQFSLSAPTIRKYLSELESEGYIKRQHGSAVLNNNIPITRSKSFEKRQQKNQAAKELIAKEAVKHINDGESIILDAGTTTLEIAKLLVNKHALTIFTPSLAIASLFHISRVSVNMLGGIYVSENYSVHGPDTENYIKRIHVDKAFVSPSGIRADYGLTSQDSLEASMKNCIVNAAEKVYAVFDSSKVGSSSIYPFAGFRDIDYIITDSDIENPVALSEIKKAGVRIILPQQ